MTEEMKRLPGDPVLLYFLVGSNVVMFFECWLEMSGFVPFGSFIYTCMPVLVADTLCWNRIRLAKGKATKLIPVAVLRRADNNTPVHFVSFLHFELIISTKRHPGGHTRE